MSFKLKMDMGGSAVELDAYDTLARVLLVSRMSFAGAVYLLHRNNHHL